MVGDAVDRYSVKKHKAKKSAGTKSVQVVLCVGCHDDVVVTSSC
jgi:hypothetical protein